MTRLQASFRLDRGSFVLDVALDVPAQGIVAIFGPSGCGKTTLLRCMAGLEKILQGHMSIAETQWQDSRAKFFLQPQQRDVGFVFQEPRLFSHLSVRQNLLYGYARTPIKQRKIQIDHVISILGIEHLLNRRIHGLSLGEQQRIAIGRAVLLSPRLLLMDEPLAALDMQRKRELLPFIQRLPAEFGIPIVYVSHAIPEIMQLADTLVMLDNGKVLASGTLTEVLSRFDVGDYLSEMAGVVLQTKVMEHDNDYALTRLEFNGHSLYVPQQSVPVGMSLRVHVLARNVSIALSRPSIAMSVLNMMDARVVDISDMHGDRHSVQIKLDVGEPLLANITRKSLAVLGLEKNQQVVVLIKAVSLTTPLMQ